MDVSYFPVDLLMAAGILLAEVLRTFPGSGGGDTKHGQKWLPLEEADGHPEKAKAIWNVHTWKVG